MATHVTKAGQEHEALHSALENALTSLGRATEDIGDDAAQALHKASDQVMHAAQQLLDATRERAADVAKGAVKEAREHPIATAAAVTAAAAAVIGLLAARHQRKH